MKNFIFSIFFLNAICCSAETIRIWKLKEIVLETTNENLVGASIENESFGVVIYSAFHESEKIQLDEQLFKAIKNRENSKEIHPFLGESENFAFKTSDGKIFFVEKDKKKHGLCRIARMDGQIWPIATISGRKTTIYSPKFASLFVDPAASKVAK